MWCSSVFSSTWVSHVSVVDRGTVGISACTQRVWGLSRPAVSSKDMRMYRSTSFSGTKVREGQQWIFQIAHEIMGHVSLGCFGKSHSRLRRLRSTCSALSCIRGRAVFQYEPSKLLQNRVSGNTICENCPRLLVHSIVRSWIGLSLYESWNKSLPLSLIRTNVPLN